MKTERRKKKVARFTLLYFIYNTQKTHLTRGVATGGISVFIPPKSAQVNFLWGNNDVRTAIQQFYTPLPPQKNFISPKTNFWLRPSQAER